MAQITEEQALNRLRAKIRYGHKIKHLAESFGVSAAFMSTVLAGKKSMTGPMLAKIGVRRAVVFFDDTKEGSDVY